MSGQSKNKWTPEMARDVLLNPAHAGVGPSEATPLISDQQWTQVVTRLAQGEVGWDATFIHLVRLTRQTLGPLPEWMQGQPWEDRKRQIRSQPGVGLRAFLIDLRQHYHRPPSA